MTPTETLVRLLLPEIVFENFDLKDLKSTDDRLDIYLDEKAICPDGYVSCDLHSKGFCPSSTLQDFPIRDMSTYLHLRRRKWEIKKTRKIISRSIKVKAEGTRITQEFASFLKDALR